MPGEHYVIYLIHGCGNGTGIKIRQTARVTHSTATPLPWSVLGEGIIQILIGVRNVLIQSADFW